MSKPAPLYDLMLLLSSTTDEEQRAKIVLDVETSIADGGGRLERNDTWGMRTLAFEINHQKDADYHLLQFQGPPALLETLTHTLRITDGVLRFRIIKNLPGTPPPPEPRTIVAATVAPAADDG